MVFCDVRHHCFFFFGFTTEAKKSYRAVAGFLTSYFKRLPGRRISVHTPKISNRHPHTVPTQNTSRNSCSPELSNPKMGSNQGLDTETTDYAQYAHFEMSVLEHPLPILDIVSVLRRHPPDTNPV
ncbi:hypothetical protein SERLA73DRAFT_125668 [Serpula lacrymans var. lacrymans S7.3]|uniref:Uncharacterized protein n=1 Tax=Serpula lacrymans var. lacrymans (strain S7.3) TaxID=936435 RepID=F8QAI0_SERL3|nr:hypothetical protein SERLA73DRAFT_125668 [Serpula lacrymans var. lacrymans S7.3]